ESSAKVPRRFVAGGIGAVMALSFYIVLGALAPTPPRLIEASPMESSAMTLRAPSIPVIDPTPARLVIPAISVDAAIEARGLAPSTDTTLTLITCSGTWNPMTQSDTQRLLVSATVA